MAQTRAEADVATLTAAGARKSVLHGHPCGAQRVDGVAAREQGGFRPERGHRRFVARILHREFGELIGERAILFERRAPRGVGG